MNFTPCPLCGSEQFKEVLQSGDILHSKTSELFTLVKCLNCSLVFLNPQPTWEELKVYYPRDYVSHKISSSIAPLTFVQKIIPVISRYKQKFFPHKPPRLLNSTQGRFLDVGCGNGHFMEELRRFRPKWEFYGLEPVPAAAEDARRRGFKVKTAFLEDADFPLDWFDVISMNHVLEHVPDPFSTLQEVYRILKPGGVLNVVVPNYQSFGSRLFKKYWYPLDLPRHLFHFTPKTLFAYAKKAGFNSAQFHFDKNPKHFLKSFRIFMGQGEKNLKPDHFNPFLWFALKPWTYILGRLHLGDVMNGEFRKVL